MSFYNPTPEPRSGDVEHLLGVLVGSHVKQIIGTAFVAGREAFSRCVDFDPPRHSKRPRKTPDNFYRHVTGRMRGYYFVG